MRKSFYGLTTSVTILIFFFIFQSCNNLANKIAESGSEFDMETVKAEIEAANQNFMDLFAAGDSVGLANSYTIDGKFMSAGAPSIVGRANIQAVMSNIIKSGITKVVFKLENVYGNEDLIAEEGELTLFVGDDIVSVEKYIVLWKKEDGRWKMFRDIYNSNVPAV
jgi:ketosteroid isomerase-like protein